MYLYYKFVIVKEQRVHGNQWGAYTPRLRCILMGLEKNYQRRALSKQTNIQIKRLFSSKVPKSAKHELCVAINPPLLQVLQMVKVVLESLFLKIID